MARARRPAEQRTKLLERTGRMDRMAFLVLTDSYDAAMGLQAALKMMNLEHRELPREVSEAMLRGISAGSSDTPPPRRALTPPPGSGRYSGPEPEPPGAPTIDPKRRPSSGGRPLVPGHIRHNWSPEEPGTDVCIKCGMHRHLKDRGSFLFVSRDGEEHLRPPFHGITPSCDEGLLAHPRRPG